MPQQDWFKFWRHRFTWFNFTRKVSKLARRNVHKKWTDDNERKLIRLSLKDKNIARISFKMGRNETSLLKKAKHLAQMGKLPHDCVPVCRPPWLKLQNFVDFDRVLEIRRSPREGTNMVDRISEAFSVPRSNAKRYLYKQGWLDEEKAYLRKYRPEGGPYRNIYQLARELGCKTGWGLLEYWRGMDSGAEANGMEM